jgi:glutamine amidotransferase
MIQIINYGLGNIKAFQTIYERLNIPVKIVSSVKQFEPEGRLILPGVGSFDWAMNRLNASGMREMIDKLVLEDKVPVLGICVGMQMMAKQSEEGTEPGLKWIDAVVKRLPKGTGLPLPHMGWNEISTAPGQSLFEEMEDTRFYFLHSYVVEPEKTGLTIAQTEYGISFTSAINDQNIYGVQFHPEKSHHWGVKLLENFAKI